MTADPPRDLPPRDDADDAGEVEEALNWDSSIRDASYVEGPKPVREKPVRDKPVREKAVRSARPAAELGASTSSATDTRSETDATAPAPTSSFLLVTYGIIAGIFLLYAIGWFTTVRRSSYIDPSALGAFMSILGEILAVAAAPVWFGAVFVLTRDSKPLVRLLWLLLGLVLLVPVPFVMGV